ncbi:MAG: type I methionyl aminopeptidase [Chloroflexota bacterium]|nr:type I methionyl aminopeptidase [Chloroflexota bacterium]
MLDGRSSQVILKSPAEIEQMRAAGRRVAETLQELAEMVRPGVRLSALNRHVVEKYERLGVVPTFVGYHGFPHAICASVNEQIVHGFATDRILEDGDILSIDHGATVDGWVGDSAITVPVGTVSAEAQRLLDVTREALAVGIDTARVGVRKGDIGAAIQAVIEGAGYGVVRQYVGHGIGRTMHEPPSMPNYGLPGSGMIMRKGMVVALEPMATIGSPETVELSDGWTVSTKDGKLSAHFEHTMALRDGEPADVLTAWT